MIKIFFRWKAQRLAILHIICGSSSVCGYISLRILTNYIKEHILLFIAVSCQIFTTVILSTMFDSSADNIKLDEFVFFFGAAVFRYAFFGI